MGDRRFDSPPTGEMPVTWGGKPALWMAWTGSNPLPDLLTLCLGSVLRHNGADFEVIVVTPDNLRQYLIPHPAYDYLSLNHRSDYLRLTLLHRYGGVYLDMDTIALRSLADIYADLSDYDLITYDAAVWGTVFGISVFVTRRGSVLTQAWSEAVEGLLDHRFDDLVAFRARDPYLGADCLGWGEVCLGVVDPIGRRLVDEGQLSARLLDPAWAHFAHGGPAYDDTLRACSPLLPDTELLILNHALLSDSVRRMSVSEILDSNLGICRLLQHALRHGEPLLPMLDPTGSATHR